LIDHYTYVFCGDGCLQEGITSEASSLAGHLGLGKLILFYDDNHVTIDGDTELSFTEDVLKRYEAYGWHTQHVKDGDHDLDGIAAALEAAQKVTDKPSIIKVTTTIGFGAAKQGTEAVHGAPLPKDDLANVKKKFGFDPTQHFVVPDEAKTAWNKVEEGKKLEAEWNALFERYSKEFPELAKEFVRRRNGELPEGWQNGLPKFTPKDPAQATRKFSQTVIQALAKSIPELIGGSADLNPSTFTYMSNSKDFQKGAFENRNIRFGVREHAMAAVTNGLAAYGGYIPYCSTFLNFLGYCLGSFTLSALSGFKCLYVFTHDSIGLGEDGPTHQAVEKFMVCRDTPNVLFLRPADGNEVVGAYVAALTQKHRPSLLALSRQNVPNLEGSSAEAVLKGAYVLQDAKTKPDIILISTGSEVSICVEAKKKLEGELNVRVVSIPSWELFSEQSLDYKESVLVPGIPVVSVEAGTISGWSKFAHASVGLTTFGTSAPYQAIYKKFGLTPENVAEKAKEAVKFYSSQTPHNLVRKPWAHL
jgi:transketolase